MTVHLGMFTMPFHHPDRAYGDILAEDQDAVILAVLMAGHDWDRPALWRRSMELLAHAVMPKFSQHAATTPAR